MGEKSKTARQARAIAASASFACRAAPTIRYWSARHGPCSPCCRRRACSILAKCVLCALRRCSRRCST